MPLQVNPPGTSIYRLREDDDFPLEDELPDDLDGDEDLDALLPDEDDREGDEARGALRDDDDEDLEGELTLGALLVEPDDRDGVLLLLPTDREGVDALGDGALRLPLDVRGTTGDRLDLELLDEPVLGMTTGVLVDGTARDWLVVGARLVPSDREVTPGVDRLTGVRVELPVTGVRLPPPDRERPARDEGALADDETEVLPVLGARERPDEDEGALVDGEDLVPEGEATLPPTEPRPNPDPTPAPPGMRVDRKKLPLEERPAP